MILILLVCLGLAALWWVLLRAFVSPARLTAELKKCLGYLIEIGVYQEQPRILWLTFKDLLAQSWSLTRPLILPSLIYCGPFVLGYLLLAHAYGHRPLHSGEKALVSVYSQTAELTTSEGLALKSEGISVKERRVWKLSCSSESNQFVQTQDWGQRAVVTESDSTLKWWLQAYPSSGIKIHYPTRQLWIGHYPIAWYWPVLICFLLSLGVSARLFR